LWEIGFLVSLLVFFIALGDYIDSGNLTFLKVMAYIVTVIFGTMIILLFGVFFLGGVRLPPIIGMFIFPLKKRTGQSLLYMVILIVQYLGIMASLIMFLLYLEDAFSQSNLLYAAIPAFCSFVIPLFIAILVFIRECPDCEQTNLNNFNSAFGMLVTYIFLLPFWINIMLILAKVSGLNDISWTLVHIPTYIFCAVNLVVVSIIFFMTCFENYDKDNIEYFGFSLFLGAMLELIIAIPNYVLMPLFLTLGADYSSSSSADSVSSSFTAVLCFIPIYLDIALAVCLSVISPCILNILKNEDHSAATALIELPDVVGKFFLWIMHK